MTDQTVTNNGRPDPTSSIVKSKTNRPFAQASKSYKEHFLDKAVMKAMLQLENEDVKNRYARVIIKIFDKIEVDTVLPNGEVKTYSYPIHKLHYGPIDKKAVDSFTFPPEATQDFIQATKFCFRDPSIWVEVNGAGKNPGGDGTGFGNTACSPFRDTQLQLREKGYYLIDLSEYLFDEDNGKWYFRIDIRLYKDADAVEANPGLWHQYGVIPGLGSLRRKDVSKETSKNTSKDVSKDESNDAN